VQLGTGGLSKPLAQRRGPLVYCRFQRAPNSQTGIVVQNYKNTRRSCG
jgi:hypothetical protein